jgi:DNA-binding NarL/FixJ family response regulator
MSPIIFKEQVDFATTSMTPLKAGEDPERSAPEGFQLIEDEKPIVRILIADDHPIVREALKALLLLEKDFEVVGEARNGREVLERVRGLDPDVLMLDLRMPDLDGLATLQTLRQSNQRTRVIIFTASESKGEFVQAIKLGCSGIMLKQTAPDLIAQCIRKVNVGETWLDSQMTAAVTPNRTGGPAQTMRGKSPERPPLSTREWEVVELVAQEYKNREMAEKMFISEQTIKNHLHNIFEKLGVSGRKDLKVYARQRGLYSSTRGH